MARGMARGMVRGMVMVRVMVVVRRRMEDANREVVEEVASQNRDTRS